MKIIETKYKGYKFRSRLEARWAVFFDAIGLPYLYEKEGYDLEGTWYLPDFWIPDWNAFVEIKGDKPSQEEKRKCLLLQGASKKTVLLIYGTPYPSEYNVILYYPEDLPYDLTEGEFTQCRRCPDIYLSAKFDTENENPVWSFRLGHAKTDPNYGGCSDRFPILTSELVNAFETARQARF